MSVANVGVHEKWTAPDNGRRPRQTEEHFPGVTQWRNAFINRTGTSPSSLIPHVANRLTPFLGLAEPGKHVVYLSIKTPINATIAGSWDGFYRELGEYLGNVNLDPNQPTVKFLPWHEPENNFLHGNQFANYHYRVLDSVKDGSYGGVEVGYSAMAYQWRPGSITTANPSQWRDVDADFYAVDVYSGRSFPLTATLPEHSGFVRWWEEIAGHGNRSGKFVVTERGFETPSASNTAVRYITRNDAIIDEFVWLRDDPQGKLCTDYVYWNSSGTEEAGGLVLDTLGENALRTWIGEFARLNNNSEPEEYLRGFSAGKVAGRKEAVEKASIELERVSRGLKSWAEAMEDE